MPERERFTRLNQDPVKPCDRETQVRAFIFKELQIDPRQASTQWRLLVGNKERKRLCIALRSEANSADAILNGSNGAPTPCRKGEPFRISGSQQAHDWIRLKGIASPWATENATTPSLCRPAPRSAAAVSDDLGSRIPQTSPEGTDSRPRPEV